MMNINTKDNESTIPSATYITSDYSLLNWSSLTIKERNLLLAILGLIQSNNQAQDPDISISLKLLSKVANHRQYGKHTTLKADINSLATKLSDSSLYYFKNHVDTKFLPFNGIRVENGNLLLLKNIEYNGLYGENERQSTGYYSVNLKDIEPLSVNEGALYLAMAKWKTNENPVLSIKKAPLLRMFGKEDSEMTMYDFSRYNLKPTINSLADKLGLSIHATMYNATTKDYIANPEYKVQSKHAIRIYFQDASEESKQVAPTTTQEPKKVATKKTPKAPVKPTPIAPVVEQTTTTTTQAPVIESPEPVTETTTVAPQVESQTESISSNGELLSAEDFIKDILAQTKDSDRATTKATTEAPKEPEQTTTTNAPVEALQEDGAQAFLQGLLSKSKDDKPELPPIPEQPKTSLEDETDAFIKKTLERSDSKPMKPRTAPTSAPVMPVMESEALPQSPSEIFEQLKNNHPELAPKPIVQEPKKNPVEPFDEYAYHSTEDLTKIIADAHPELVATREMPQF